MDSNSLRDQGSEDPNRSHNYGNQGRVPSSQHPDHPIPQPRQSVRQSVPEPHFEEQPQSSGDADHRDGSVARSQRFQSPSGKGPLDPLGALGQGAEGNDTHAFPVVPQPGSQLTRQSSASESKQHGQRHSLSRAWEESGSSEVKFQVADTSDGDRPDSGHAQTSQGPTRKTERFKAPAEDSSFSSTQPRVSTNPPPEQSPLDEYGLPNLKDMKKVLDAIDEYQADGRAAHKPRHPPADEFGSAKPGNVDKALAAVADYQASQSSTLKTDNEDQQIDDLLLRSQQRLDKNVGSSHQSRRFSEGRETGLSKDDRNANVGELKGHQKPYKPNDYADEMDRPTGANLRSGPRPEEGKRESAATAHLKGQKKAEQTSGSDKKDAPDGPKTRSMTDKRTKELEAYESYNHRHSDTDIEVVFEVLLSPEMAEHGKDVFVVMGPPVSDWNARMCLLKPKFDAPDVIQPGNYTYLSGTIPFSDQHTDLYIPYKYVVYGRGDFTWESICAQSSKVGAINRCLFVPGRGGAKFYKFDDVILPLKVSNKSTLLRAGREAASKWMLPRPNTIKDPGFDFEEAWKRFDQVIKTHGLNGTKICVGDSPDAYHNPSGYSVESVVKSCLQQMLKNLQNSKDKESDREVMLRSALYVTFATNTKFISIAEAEHYLAIFDVLLRSRDLIPDRLPKSVRGELQNQVVESLKKLVLNFVDLPINVWSKSHQSHWGDWIFAIPFIDHWDLSGSDSIPLVKLTKWKEALKTRYIHFLFYTQLDIRKLGIIF